MIQFNNLNREDFTDLIISIASQSNKNQEDFCKGLITFLKINPNYLWLLPTYYAVVNSIENYKKKGEISANINGFYKLDRFSNELSARSFSKYAMYFDFRSLEFSWDSNGKTCSFFELLLDSLNLNMDLFIKKIKNKDREVFSNFTNIVRTILYSTIVRAYYSKFYSTCDIANIIIAPIHDEQFKSTITKKTNLNIGDDLFEAIEDVLFALRIDIRNKEYNGWFGDYSINFEKIAKKISTQKSYQL